MLWPTALDWYKMKVHLLAMFLGSRFNRILLLECPYQASVKCPILWILTFSATIKICIFDKNPYDNLHVLVFSNMALKFS